MERQNYHQELIKLIQSSPWFMSVLEAVRACNPPDWLVGAGVIRNLVWDYLHQYQTPTPLADIDVIFFDPQDVRPERDYMVQQQLNQRFPQVKWEATNQAAVRLLSNDQILIVAPCGLADLFNMALRRNPCRVTREQFVQRLHSKQILHKWPRVQVIYDA